MKRANPSIKKWIIGPGLVSVVCVLTLADSMAQTARFTIIDARDGLTPEVVDSYAAALGANSKTPFVKNRVKIVTSAKHGFDVGAIELPNHIRSLDTEVSILIRQGAALEAPITANEVTTSRRIPQRIRQTTHIQGQ